MYDREFDHLKPGDTLLVKRRFCSHIVPGMFIMVRYVFHLQGNLFLIEEVGCKHGKCERDGQSFIPRKEFFELIELHYLKLSDEERRRAPSLPSHEDVADFFRRVTA